MEKIVEGLQSKKMYSHKRKHIWWRHKKETFSSLLALCEGNPPVTGGFPSQRPVTRSFGVFFDPPFNNRLSQQSRHRWFETPSRSLWRHYIWWSRSIMNVYMVSTILLEAIDRSKILFYGIPGRVLVCLSSPDTINIIGVLSTGGCPTITVYYRLSGLHGQATSGIASHFRRFWL